MATNEELVLAIRDGSRELLPELWNQVHRFAYATARRRISLAGELGGASLEDLYQSGYIALVEAVDSWSADPGYKFLTWYEFYLKSAFADAGGYRSRRQANDPLHHAVSIDTPIDEDADGSTLIDLIPAIDDPIAEIEDRIYNEQLHDALETALQQLPPDEEFVIRAIYYERRAVQDIGPRARDVQQRALEHLRRPLISRNLRMFIEIRVPHYRSSRGGSFARASADDLVAVLRERVKPSTAYVQR